MIHILRKSFTAAMLVVAGGSVAHAQGTITTIAGTGLSGFSGDGGAAVSATFSNPRGVGTDAAGNVYIADMYNGRVRKVDAATGIISTFAGGGSSYSYGISPTLANLWMPTNIYVNPAGDILITDHYHDMTFVVDHTTGLIAARCGCHSQGCDGDGGPGIGAKFMVPAASCEDNAGNTYVADQGCNKVRTVNGSTSIISTLAPATSPLAVFFDPTTTTDLYVAEGYSSRISKINVATGVVTVIAGTGVSGNTGDGGDAISAQIGTPSAIYIDNNHNLYFTDQTYNVVRRVRLNTGKIHKIAGTGTAGYTGDGGYSSFATLNGPAGLWMDNAGYIYIADAGNNVIRKIKPKGLKSNGTTIGVNTVSIFPNPSNGQFTLTTDEDLDNSTVCVYNVVGAQVYTATMSGTNNTIDLGNQATGIYTLVIKTAEGVHTEKLTIQ